MKKQASHSTSVSPERGRQIEKRCLAYVLAAGGTALVTAPAKAEIVYTPTHKVVDTPGSLMVDLNNDGISDLELDDFSVVASSYGNIKQLGIRGAQNPLARVIGKKAGFPFSNGVVFPAPYGFSIGPNTPKSFLGPLRTASGPAMVGGRFFAGYAPSFYGPWLKATDKYLGIQFSINGQAHYGWARLTVKTLIDRYLNIHIRAILTGYAYETQPNTAILAGDEGPMAKPTATDAGRAHSPSLALLSLGSVGLDVWRRGQDCDAPKKRVPA